MKKVNKWIEKMRSKWAKKVEKLQEHKGYTKGVVKMCEFSNKVRNFLTKAQSMCYVNDILKQGSNSCKRQQLVGNIGSDLSAVARQKYARKKGEIKSKAKALANKPGTTTASVNSKYM